jgi:hypothetical protein
VGVEFFCDDGGLGWMGTWLDPSDKHRCRGGGGGYRGGGGGSPNVCVCGSGVGG